jgi:hypothetical protein
MDHVAFFLFVVNILFFARISHTTKYDIVFVRLNPFEPSYFFIRIHHTYLYIEARHHFK